MKRRASLVIIWLMLLPAALSASKGRPEGASPPGMDLVPASSVGEDGSWKLAIWTWSYVRDAGGPALATIEVGPGAEIIEGPVSREIGEKEHWYWPLKLRKIGGAPVQIVGRLKIPGREPGSYYYHEGVLKIRVDGSQIVVLEKRPVQRVAYRGGRKFRLGGEFPVAIEDEELESPQRIDSRPELMSKPEVTCNGCGLSQAMDIALVVTVGKSGDVTWIRPSPLSEAPVPETVWEAVVSAVGAYRFRPALSDQRPVADFSIIRVRVLSGD